VSELAFHNLEGNVSVISKRTDFQLEQARERVLTVARNIADGNFKPSRISTATSVRFAACVRLARSRPRSCDEDCEHCGKIARLTDEVPNTSHPKLPRKNLGDAFGVPFDFVLTFLMLLFLLCLFLGCHWFYSPFHFHGKICNDVLLQLNEVFS